VVASLSDVPIAGALLPLAKSADQAKAVLTVADALADKSLRQTVAITAGRGRGKSAALGLALAAAIGHGCARHAGGLRGRRLAVAVAVAVAATVAVTGSAVARVARVTRGRHP
jgi:tRNA(Met) C34 N-acetyltransferase TmcA